MHHRIVAFVVIAVAANVSSLAANQAVSAESAPRPNIIFILADDKYAFHSENGRISREKYVFSR